MLGIFLLLRYYFDNKLYPYFISTSILVLFMLLFFAPKIERYTQGTYIDFCKSLKGQDVYIQTLSLKSYATLFYSNLMPFVNDSKRNHSWLYDGEVDKDVYFISVTKDSLYTYYPRSYINLIENKNGYDFFIRKKLSNRN